MPATAIGTILWLQAILLRVLGPPGDLTLRSIDAVSVPAAVSLLWAVSGGVLTFWGHRRKSRPLWVGGATLLVGATVKIVLFDIGSLGELSNILAVIAAGTVFLAVGWVAPLPPAPPREPEPEPEPEPENDSSLRAAAARICAAPNLGRCLAGATAARAELGRTTRNRRQWNERRQQLAPTLRRPAPRATTTGSTRRDSHGQHVIRRRVTKRRRG